MHRFCLLTTMELILIPNCSLLYLHSNDIKSLKIICLKKVIAKYNFSNKSNRLTTGVYSTLKISTSHVV